MRTFLLSSLVIIIGVSGTVACSSDSTGSTSGAATDGGASSSGGSGKSCYLKSGLEKCECTTENADAAHPTSEWSKVLNCSTDTLDQAAHCSGASAPCTCDVLHCEIDLATDFCACGTRSWTDVNPAAEKAELTSCALAEWCCESADGSACHCGKGTPACAAGFTQTATAACSTNDRKVPSGKTDSCGK
jgi:hypothetical protein